MERSAAARQQESKALLERSAATIDAKLSEVEAMRTEQTAQVRKAREQTKRVVEEQQLGYQTLEQQLTSDLHRATTASQKAEAQSVAQQRALSAALQRSADLEVEVGQLRDELQRCGATDLPPRAPTPPPIDVSAAEMVAVAPVGAAVPAVAAARPAVPAAAPPLPA